jgi:lipid-binding SYLF domain-containing protein
MKGLVAVAAALVLIAGTSFAAESKTDVVDRADAAAKALQEIMAAPDKGIPGDVMNSAKCVAIVPSMKQAGFIFGGKYGRGLATCRTAHGWSAPAPFIIEGGSWGLQIGGEAIDLIMLVMNQHGMDQMLASKFKIGADVSGAAGPVGRQAEATTDWKLHSEVLTYSRSRGVFAGITLDGAVIKQDDDSTEAMYGKVQPFAALLGGIVPTPTGVEPFVHEVALATQQAKEMHNENASTRTSGGTGGTASTNNKTSSDKGTSGAVSSDTNHNDTK